VHRREDDAQRLGIEHHRDMARAGEVRQEIGVAAPLEARQPERFLVDRRGRDRLHHALLRIGDRAHDDVVRRAPGGGAQLARGERRARRRAVDDRLAHVEHAWIGGGARRHLGTDTGGIRRG